AGFSASNVRATAGLELLHCRFRAPGKDAFAVCLDGIRVQGDLHFRANTVQGPIVARRMQVTGNLLLNGLKLSSFDTSIGDCGRFYEASIGEIGQKPVLDAYKLPAAESSFAILNLHGSTVDGTLNLGGLPSERNPGLDDPFEFEGPPDARYPMLTVVDGTIDGVSLKIGDEHHLWN